MHHDSLRFYTDEHMVGVCEWRERTKEERKAWLKRQDGDVVQSQPCPSLLNPPLLP